MMLHGFEVHTHTTMNGNEATSAGKVEEEKHNAWCIKTVGLAQQTGDEERPLGQAKPRKVYSCKVCGNLYYSIEEGVTFGNPKDPSSAILMGTTREQLRSAESSATTPEKLAVSLFAHPIL